LPTKSAGRVSIRVLPDSSRFREDLKLSLERIEKTMKAEIPAILSVTRESIRRLKEQIRDLEARIKVEPYVTEEQLRELKQKIQDVDPHIDANLDAANAQRRLAFISRDREVTLFVRVSRASVAAAASTLAALSGTRMLGNFLEPFLNVIKNIDKNAPRIGLMATGITTLSSSVLALISNLGGLAGSFANLGKLSVLGPALFTATGISIGVLIAAFKDMKKVLKDLKPSFKQLQDTISAKFWAQAAQPIRNLVNTLMPQLKRSLGDVAASWGKLFGKMASEIQRNVTPKELAFMMGNLSRAIDIASNAMKPLIHAFNTLGKFGSNYLPRLSNFIVDMSKKFDAFITKADKSGELTAWAEDGITAMKDLGKVIYQAGRVFSALNQAAARAGGSTFSELAGGLEKLSNLMRTEGFQKGFETIFAGAHLLMDGLLDGIKRLGPGLSVFAVTFNTVASLMGKTLGALGDNLSALFADPTLNQGLKDFFSGFLSFISELKPAMKPLGEIIGTLGTALGSLLAQAAPLISSALSLLAPLFKDIWKELQPLIPDLVDLADTFIKELGPPLVALVKEVLPPLIPIIAALAPLVAALVKAASPVLVVFFQQLGDTLRTAGPAIRDAATWLTDLVTAMNGFPKAFAQLSFGDKEGGLMTIMKLAIDHPEIPAFFNILSGALGGMAEKFQALGTVLGIIQTLANPATGIPAIATGVYIFVSAANALFGISEKWNGFWTGVQSIVTTVTQAMPPQLTGALFFMTTAFNLFITIKGQWDGFWGGLSAPVSIALSIVTGNLRGGLAGMVAAVVGWIFGTTARWNTFWQTFTMRVVTGMASAGTNLAGGFPRMIMSALIGMMQIGQAFSRGWDAIARWVPVAFAQIAGGIGPGVAIMLGQIFPIPGQIASALLAGIGTLAGAGRALIGGFAQGISDGVGAAVAAATFVAAQVAKVFPHSPAEIGPFSGKGWTLYSGRATIEGFALGMKQRTGMLQSQALATMSAAQLNGGTFSQRSAPSVGMYSQATRDRALIEIQGDYYGATPEKVANEFDKKLRRAGLVAQLGKVGV